MDHKLNNLIPELCCSNFEASLAFYTGVLGFKILYQREEDGFAMLDHQGAHLMLDEMRPGKRWISIPPKRPFRRGLNLSIDTDDVQHLYEKFEPTSPQIFLPLEEKWYRAGDVELGNRQFIVMDPDGFLLRFAQDLGTRPHKEAA